MPLKKKKKTLQFLKEIGEDFGGKISIHGLSYVCDPLLPSCERLLWLFLFLSSLGLAVYLNVCSYAAWRENMVVTNLRSTGRPVNQLDFPTVTICGSGLHMAAVEDALKEDFIDWRKKRGRTEMDNIEEDLTEYMEETYEIPNEVNILDILNTMIAPNNAEASLAANAARENFAACKEDHDTDRDENEDKSKRNVEHVVEFRGTVDISKGRQIGSLPFLEKEFSLKLSFFVHEPEGFSGATGSVSDYQIFGIRGETEEGNFVESSLYFEDGRLKVAFPDIHFSDPESISQRLTRNPKFGEWNLLTIWQERNEANKFKFYASLNGVREIRTTNRNASVIKTIEIYACFNESQPMRGQIKDFKLQNGEVAENISEESVDSEITAAVKDKVKQRECIMLTETTTVENNYPVDDQRHDDLPAVDLFLNPARKTELDHIKNTTVERAKDYFRSMDMGRVYPALFRLLWPSTLLCPLMVSACSLAGTPHNCSLLFSRCIHILNVIHVEYPIVEMGCVCGG